MIPLKTWLQSDEYRRIDALSMGELVTREFFRDPLVPIYLNKDGFYSPASGTILYAFEKLGPNDPIVEIKGKKFTVRQALDDDKYDYNSIVIGIFMSSRDIHVNRMPASGYLSKENKTNYLFTANISMIMEEDDLIKEAEISKEDQGYLFMNERNIIKVHCPRINGNYYTIQIAEKDIDCCLTWSIGKHLHQCRRFGQVRYGSQVDLIIPLTGKVKFEMLAKPKYHVEAGVDLLLKIL